MHPDFSRSCLAWALSTPECRYDTARMFHCPEGAEFSRPFGTKDVPNIANMKMRETFPIVRREYSQRRESR